MKPKNFELVKDWISIQLDLLGQANADLMFGTPLHRGIDMTTAQACFEKGIRYNVFLSCIDQDRFWDHNSQRLFAWLCERAEEVAFISKEPYNIGCIQKQMEEISKWASKDNGYLLLIRRKYLTQSQVKDVNLFRNGNIKTLRIY
jgi:hypothetical protein